MSEPAVPARRGRPRDESKRDAIAVAATALFAELGYDGVAMEMVAARAGVSKMTVYKHFGDKETLFETVVITVVDRIVSDAVWTDGQGLPLAQRLTEIGVTYLTTILGPYGRMMINTLRATAHANEALARRFFDVGPGRTQATLATVIAEATARGQLRAEAPALAAEDLLGLWEGGLLLRGSFGLPQQVAPEDIARRAAHGTQVFLRAYAPGP